MESYLSITVHYISSKWEMESNILKTQHFPERHTGVNISHSIEEVVGSFNIDSKIVGIVHDTCANAELASELMLQSHGWESVQCAAHKLQLVIQEGLEINIISRAIAATRKLVGHFKHSALTSSQLSIRQQQMNQPQRKLKQECVTRWNSTLYMIHSVVASRWPIVAVLSDETVTKRQYRTLDLKNEQWELLSDLAKPLELLEIATVFLSQEYNVSCSCVYPIIDGLINNLIPAEDDQPIIKQLKTTISAALRRRWKFTDIDILKPPAF